MAPQAAVPVQPAADLAPQGGGGEDRPLAAPTQLYGNGGPAVPSAVPIVASAPIPVPLPAPELVQPVPVPVPAPGTAPAAGSRAATVTAFVDDADDVTDVLPARTPARRAAPRPTRARKAAEPTPAVDTGSDGGDD